MASSPMKHCAIIIHGLPLGVTPEVLRRCLEEASNEALIFPQPLEIRNAEALVYLPSHHIQTKLSTIQVLCDETVVNIDCVNNKQAMEWISYTVPSKHRVLALNSDAHRHTVIKEPNNAEPYNAEPIPSHLNHPHETKRNQQSPPPIAFDINHDADPQPNEHHLYENKEDSGEHKEDVLPTFLSTEALWWYQYLAYKSGKSYVTFSAEWSWDIERQWIAKEAEETEVNVEGRYRFYVEDKEVDIVLMKVNQEYDLKRTRKLVGRLSVYGFIEFELVQGVKMTFLYDRTTGYGKGVREGDINIGDMVVFETIWNKKEDDTYIHNLTHLVQPGGVQCGGIQHDMVAFNVRLNSNDMDPYNLEYLADNDVPRVDEFKAQRVEGLVVSLTHDQKKGFIVSYPYPDNPEQHLTLMYCGKPLWINMRVECSIGLNPNASECGGHGLFKYVALDVMKKNWNGHHHPLVTQEILRPYRGVVLVAPTSKGDGFIHNERVNNMCTLLYDTEHEYKVGMCVNYNEIYRSEKGRNDYVAKNVLTIDKVDRNTMNTYVLGSALDIHNQENIEFKYAKTDGKYVDIQLVVEESVMYFKKLMYRNGSGGLLFGVDGNNCIVGQQHITSAKRRYIKRELEARINHVFSAECLSIEFKQVIDRDGYVMKDRYVIVVRFVTFEHKQDDTGGYDIGYDEQPNHKQPKKISYTAGTLPYTTPRLNVRPIPPDNERGRNELSKRLETKLNEMLTISYYTDSDKLNHIMNLASADFYYCKKEAWEELVKLERTAVRESAQQQRHTAQQEQQEIHHKPRYITSQDMVEVDVQSDWQQPDVQSDWQQPDVQSDWQQQDISYSGAAVLSPTTTRHPKSLFLEWAQKAGAAAPKASFTDIFDAPRNMRIWTCQLTYQGQTYRHKASTKKAAETKCFAELGKAVMNRHNMLSLS
eukprot:994562_1